MEQQTQATEKQHIIPSQDHGPEGEPPEADKIECTPTTQSPITGTCHCGNITVTVPGKPQFINACHCSVCYRYGAEWAYYLRRDVKVELKEGAGTNAYIWGQRTLAFHACDRCNCMICWWPAWREEDGGKRFWGVGVNTRMMHWEVWSRVERRTEFQEY